MSYERFGIGHDDGQGRMWFEVRIFDTREEMRAHWPRTLFYADRLEAGQDLAFYAEAEALCSPRRVLTVDRKGRVVKVSSRIGTLFFHRELLTPTVVVHELIHAALTYWRERGRGEGYDRADFGDGGTIEDEEAFAYIYGGLFFELNLQLHARGHWD